MANPDPNTSGLIAGANKRNDNPKRINIVLPSALLKRIDAVTDNRSAWLEALAFERLERGGK